MYGRVYITKSTKQRQFECHLVTFLQHISNHNHSE